MIKKRHGGSSPHPLRAESKPLDRLQNTVTARRIPSR